MRSWQATSAGKGSDFQARGSSADTLNSGNGDSPRASRSASELVVSKGKSRWSAEDVRSVGETSTHSRNSCSSSSSSSNRKSSRSSHSSRSSSSSSSRSGSRSGRHPKPRSCIRTVFPDDELEIVADGPYIHNGLALTEAERHDIDSTSASDYASTSGSEPSSPQAFSPIQTSLREYDRSQSERFEAFWGEGVDLFEKSRKSTWRKLRHRRLLTNLFNFRPQSDTSFSDRQESQSMLVDIHVLGSPGPIRLVVDKTDLVQDVIESALHAYDVQKRQPALGLSYQPFMLYCKAPEFEEMDERSSIGEYGLRHFYLYPKPDSGDELNTSPKSKKGTKKSSSIKSLFEKSVIEMQSWGMCVMKTLYQNFGCLASSLYHLNFDTVMGAVLKALR
ncbi:hypothetical protein MPTK1_3g15560 [Marchantia polymorpha subsp. ruderalis]|uniref:DUF7054 domain-containing protein n=2 Tax=Marchantia polymorpha TaxID=3197 RepID=A0A176W6U2_MARPO|nr:hypothetical protein AXG93_3096s1020 [Marchantia polymorpha subsp. ruderalis]PTQ48843.1 hypothetical protein MARPO_0004s0116 [Marchantia polymorpha]BBN05737.1 hypothetical protein Mp_3g15560 [Marchantia polymorpha subsp. ruderalis]|eukprot:PTQ48843.1 hypothetical protein MARPO_0004s0116 [Marchantia polymorpha]